MSLFKIRSIVLCQLEAMIKLKRCFHGFQFHGRLYSTSPTSKDGFTNPLLLQFLVNSVGFSEAEAISIATIDKVSPRFKSTSKSQLVVDFLKSSGFDETHIRKLVTVNPKVLHNKVEQTLKPKIRAFQELGFSGSDLGLIISQYPHVLNRSVNGHIVPALEMLKSLFGSNEQLVSLLLNTKSQKLLSSGSLKYLPDNVLLLQSYGMPRQKINWLMQRNFLILLQNTQSLEEILKGVEEKLGIPRTSSMFFHGIYALQGKTGDKLKSWLELVRSSGWSETEISKLLRKFPQCLTLSENLLRVKLKYYMEDLGYGSDYLAAHPALLSYSVEKKIVPRMAVMQALKEKQLLKKGVGFYYSVAMAESKFMEKYVLPIREKFPELYEYYIQTKAGSLTKT